MNTSEKRLSMDSVQNSLMINKFCTGSTIPGSVSGCSRHRQKSIKSMKLQQIRSLNWILPKLESWLLIYFQREIYSTFFCNWVFDILRVVMHLCIFMTIPNIECKASQNSQSKLTCHLWWYFEDEGCRSSSLPLSPLTIPQLACCWYAGGSLEELRPSCSVSHRSRMETQTFFCS